MNESIEVVFLGTGTSHGIPVIACDCWVCHSPDPRDRRDRAAILVRWRGRTILVDTPPELRHQLLRVRVRDLDAVLYTHTHADHLFGLDDVRVFSSRSGRPMPVHGTPETLANLRQQFFYAFTGPAVGGGVPQLELHPIEPADRPFEVAGLPVQPIPVLHGPTRVLGFRFANLAYVTDTNHIPDASLDLLRNLDVLILDALREQPHPTHFSLPEALEVVAHLRPRRAYFTHLCHELGHAETSRRLPVGVELAYDGLTIASPVPGRRASS